MSEERRPEAEPNRAAAEREHVGWGAPGPLRAHLLSSDELSSLITATGTGVISWRGIDVNRFREDALL
ncbi:MAG TPA: hypothetical protein VG963_28780, partial [Polyangiaceae bacterium]|nr:hypothetical protein [Polyangiaceae bacterium]